MPVFQQIDNAVLSFIQTNLHFPLLDTIMPVISVLANNGVIWIILAILLLFFKEYRATGFTILIALLLCLLISDLTLKPLIARIRPCVLHPEVVLLIPQPTDFSFPSGHTMSSFASATVLFIRNKRLGIVALVIASLIAFSRLYLFVHYPTDIIGGMLLGFAAAYIAVFIAAVLKKHFKSNSV